MAEVGVIALDPFRLARLEGYLDCLDQGCRRRSAEVADVARTAGVPVPPVIAELDLVAAWCRGAVDDIRWRRALLDGLPPLPVPPFSFRSRSAAEARAESLVERLEAALHERPPRPDRLRRLLAEAARGVTSPAFVRALVEGLGPGRIARLQELSTELDLAPAAAVAPGGAGSGTTSDAPGPPVGDLAVSGVTIGDVRELVVGALGPDHPLLDWLDDLPPIVADAIEASDELAATVGNVIQAGRSMRRTPVPTLAPVAAGTLLLDLVDLARDPSDVRIWNATSSVLSLVAAGPVRWPRRSTSAPRSAVCSAGWRPRRG